MQRQIVGSLSSLSLAFSGFCYSKLKARGPSGWKVERVLPKIALLDITDLLDSHEESFGSSCLAEV